MCQIVFCAMVCQFLTFYHHFQLINYIKLHFLGGTPTQSSVPGSRPELGGSRARRPDTASTEIPKTANFPQKANLDFELWIDITSSSW